jgi:hypothetical protein
MPYLLPRAQWDNLPDREKLKHLYDHAAAMEEAQAKLAATVQALQDAAKKRAERPGSAS